MEPKIVHHNSRVWNSTQKQLFQLTDSLFKVKGFSESSYLRIWTWTS